MPDVSRARGWCAGVVVATFLVEATLPPPAYAINVKKTAIKLAVCGGGAYGGYKLGEKLANAAVRKFNISGADEGRYRRAIQIGMAAALCGTGVLLVGTVYGKLSKRDREAREKEMAAALADANPNTRSYVLPDSKLPGELTTEAPEMDDGKECRWQVDVLAQNGEPARTRFCRDSANDKYDLDL